MPIFMDRHDAQDTITAKDVAQLHHEDLKVQDQYDCRVLTYWFDEKRKTAFCLIDAPDEMAIQKLHNHAHGQVPHQIIQVDASIVESFLGRIEDPEKAQNTELNIINDPAFRIIMVVALMRLPLVEPKAVQPASKLQSYNTAIVDVLNINEGKLVKQTENHFLVSFKSVSDAARAGLEIQSIFKKYRGKNNKVFLKVAVSAGLPVTDKKLFFEDAIKLAERMCKVIKGEVVASSEVKDLFDSENGSGLSKTMFCLTQLDEKFINLLMDYTEFAWNNTNLKVADFCKPVGCSKSQLYRKMILLTGKSPITFIQDYRLNEALLLLGKNTCNISEIAYKTGFTSPSYFSKCFQKKYGHFPSYFLPAK